MKQQHKFNVGDTVIFSGSTKLTNSVGFNSDMGRILRLYKDEYEIESIVHSINGDFLGYTLRQLPYTWTDEWLQHNNPILMGGE